MRIGTVELFFDWREHTLYFTKPPDILGGLFVAPRFAWGSEHTARIRCWYAGPFCFAVTRVTRYKW